MDEYCLFLRNIISLIKRSRSPNVKDYDSEILVFWLYLIFKSSQKLSALCISLNRNKFLKAHTAPCHLTTETFTRTLYHICIYSNP